MNEEMLFAYTDELMMEAQEDHRGLIRELERRGYTADDLCAELRAAIAQEDLDWSRIYILAVMGVALND